jgi:hypothetical protein
MNSIHTYVLRVSSSLNLLRRHQDLTRLATERVVQSPR